MNARVIALTILAQILFPPTVAGADPGEDLVRFCALVRQHSPKWERPTDATRVMSAPTGPNLKAAIEGLGLLANRSLVAELEAFPMYAPSTRYEYLKIVATRLGVKDYECPEVVRAWMPVWVDRQGGFGADLAYLCWMNFEADPASEGAEEHTLSRAGTSFLAGLAGKDEAAVRQAAEARAKKLDIELPRNWCGEVFREDPDPLEFPPPHPSPSGLDPPLAPAPVAIYQSVLQGDGDQDHFDRRLSTQVAGLEKCWQGSRGRKSDQVRKIKVSFTVGKERALKTWKVELLDLPGDTPLVRCVRKRVKRWTFPTPGMRGLLEIWFSPDHLVDSPRR